VTNIRINKNQRREREVGGGRFGSRSMRETKPAIVSLFLLSFVSETQVVKRVMGIMRYACPAKAKYVGNKYTSLYS
jgi:hypothetical protein